MMIASHCQRANKRFLLRSISSSMSGTHRHNNNNNNKIFRYSTSSQQQQEQDGENDQKTMENANHDTTTTTTAPPETVGDSLRSPSFGQLPPDATEEEKQKFLQEEELRKKRKQLGYRLQLIGGLGLVASVSMLLYLKKLEDEEEEEKKRREGGGGGGGGADIGGGAGGAEGSKIGLDSVRQMERAVALSVEREKQEVKQFKQTIQDQYNDFYGRYMDERRKRDKYTPTEDELRGQIPDVIIAEEQQHDIAAEPRTESNLQLQELQEQGKITAAQETAEIPVFEQVPALNVVSGSSVDVSAYENQISTLQEEIEQLTDNLQQLQASRDRELSVQKEKIAEVERQLASANKDLEIAVEKHENELREKLEEQKHNFSIQYQEDNLKRVEAIDKLTARVQALNYVYYENAQYFDDAYELQKLSVGILALQQALNTSGPLKPEVDALKNVNQTCDDELVNVLLDSIPQDTIVMGVPKLMDLERSFRKIKRQALSASYAPQNMGFLGKLYSKAASLFVMNEEGYIEGNDVGAILARAQYYLEHERLDQAIWELKNIEPNTESMEYLHVWLADANNRLQLDQINDILTNHLINLTESRDTYLFPAHQMDRITEISGKHE